MDHGYKQLDELGLNQAHFYSRTVLMPLINIFIVSDMIDNMHKRICAPLDFCGNV